VKYLGLLFAFLGYLLVYAATANHGRFATHPWLGLVADAYTGDVLPVASGKPSGDTSTAEAPIFSASLKSPAILAGGRA
jgi:hypothetical protein